MEIATLIITSVSLFVMILTLYVTCRMLRYMKDSDIIKSKESEKRRREQVLSRIKCKEEQLEKQSFLATLSGSGAQAKVDALKDEIDELRSQL